MGQAISAFVLDGGHGTWPDELKHDDSGAPESHSHTCRKQRGRITPGVEELDAGGSQNVPASRILAWVDGRVGARDGYGACWDTHPGLGQARQMKPGVQACQVAETRRKTHERHCVHRLDVTLDDLLFGEPTVAAIAWRSAPSYCTAMVSVPGLAEAGAAAARSMTSPK